MALATLAQLKTQLGIVNSETKYDSKLTMFLNAASSWVETYCDRRFESQSYVELINGNRANYFITDQWPIISVTELRISSSRDWASSTSLIPATDYGIASDGIGITYYPGYLPQGYDNVKITYVAGYATIPYDIQLGCIWAAEWFYLHNNRGDMGRTTASKTGESVGVLSDVPAMVKQVIDPYRRMDFASSALAPSHL